MTSPTVERIHAIEAKGEAIEAAAHKQAEKIVEEEANGRAAASYDEALRTAKAEAAERLVAAQDDAARVAAEFAEGRGRTMASLKAHAGAHLERAIGHIVDKAVNRTCRRQ